MDESRNSTRREFLQAAKRWSGAVATLAVTGGIIGGNSQTASAWVNGTWANRSGGWVNRYGGSAGWVNRSGGGSGAAWANRSGGGGTAAWANRYGGGGAAWVNR